MNKNLYHVAPHHFKDQLPQFPKQPFFSKKASDIYVNGKNLYVFQEQQSKDGLAKRVRTVRRQKQYSLTHFCLAFLIETSCLNCKTNHMTDLYMKYNTGLKWFIIWKLIFDGTE